MAYRREDNNSNLVGKAAQLLGRRNKQTAARLSDVVAQVTAVRTIAARRKRKADDVESSVALETKDRSSPAAALLQYFADVSDPSSGRYADSLDVDRIRRLLAAGADPNCRDRRRRTALHEVAVNWNPTVAALLVGAGAKVDAVDDRGRAPLHAAAGANFASMCKMLVRLGAEVDRKDANGHTPLFCAAKTDSARALRQLAAMRAECQLTDWRGRTPLYVAAELDRSTTVEALLDLGADAFSQDDSGQIAFVPMVKKMPQLAKEALKQLHKKSRMERKQRIDLFRLDPKLPSADGATKAEEAKDHETICTPYHSAIKAITSTNNYSLVITPVVKNLIAQQWLCFGRWRAIFQLLVQLLTIVMWTAFAVIKEWTNRYHYDLPNETYRIVILVFAACLTGYSIVEEILEYIRAKKRHGNWQEWNIRRLESDQNHCALEGLEWNYLQQEIDSVKSKSISYFSDAWNYLDWLSHFVLIASLSCHFADVGYPGGGGNLLVARWHVRLMAVNIIMQWMRLLKFVKPFEFLGAFVVMLGMLVGDLVKFFLLYLEFFAPFACVFWITFGGTNNLREADIEAAGTLANYISLNFTRISVQDFGLVNNFLFSIFRITLVDDFDYDSMAQIDVVTAQILLVLWFAISAILFLNLFIAQLSETFKAVYDNAKATAVMEKAKTIQGFYEAMMISSRVQYHRMLHSSCHPLELPYDDDVTDEDGAEEMQKATLQMRETLTDMREKFNRMYGSRLGVDAEEEGDGDGEEKSTSSMKEGEQRPEEDARMKLVSEAAARLEEAETRLRQQLGDFTAMLRDVAIVASRGRSAAASAAAATAAAAAADI